jgi:Skp family chaperone for outer membrane proteins
MPAVIIKQSRKSGNGWVIAVVILAVIGSAWIMRHADRAEDAETRLRRERERTLEIMRKDPQAITNLRRALEKSGSAKKALENQANWLEDRAKAKSVPPDDQLPTN